MSKSKHYPDAEQEHLPPDDEPEVEHHDEIEHPDGGVGEGGKTPDEGIRHRGNPPAPPTDAPVPPQDIKDPEQPKKGED
jgi:hypothetical protein